MSTFSIGASSKADRKILFLGRTKLGYYLWTSNKNYILKYPTEEKARENFETLLPELPDEMMDEVFDDEIYYIKAGSKTYQTTSNNNKYVISALTTKGNWVYLSDSNGLLVVPMWTKSFNHAVVFDRSSDAVKYYKQHNVGIDEIKSDSIAVRKVMFKAKLYLEGNENDEG